MRALRILTAAVVLALGAGAAATDVWAGWQDTASRFDRERLSRIDEARTKALGEAEHGAPARDLSIIHAVLDPAPRRASVSSLLGNWRCRTIKLGGITPDVIYTWFRCRISMRGGGPYLQKLTGTQFTNGYLYPDGNGSFVYLGGSSVRGEPRHAYSGNGATAGAPVTPDDQIGLLSVIGPGHARVELPYPLQESTMDVLELRR
jgi:hypothetical protein